MKRTIGALVLVAATPAWAQERDYCPARPGLGEPACTIAPGRRSAEIGLTEWQGDRNAGTRTDSVTLGDSLLRLGVADHAELSLGWAGWGWQRTHAPGMPAQVIRGTGDVTLAFKRNLRNPDGGGFSLAIEPHATLPAGSGPLTEGDWSAGVTLPMSEDLGHGLSLQLTSAIDAAVNESGSGRHAEASSVLALGVGLGSSVTATFEGEAIRDWEAGRSTAEAYGGVSLAWMARDDLQLDAGAVAGLDARAADIQLYLGVSRRF